MSTSRPPRDPAHEPLREVRRGLLRLHKALIDSERGVYEAEHGALSNGQFLEALMENDFFQWLRPYSGLIVEIDEALADREHGVTGAEAGAFVERVGTLVAPAPPGMLVTARLDEARRRDPGVTFSYGELNRGIANALKAYQQS